MRSWKRGRYLRNTLAKGEGDDAARIEEEASVALVPVALVAIASDIAAEVVFRKHVLGVVKDLARDGHLGHGAPREDEAVEGMGVVEGKLGGGEHLKGGEAHGVGGLKIDCHAATEA